MRKLILQQWATVDNKVADDAGGLGFVSAQPFGELPAGPFKDSIEQFIASVDTMILGRTTYEMSKDYWPEAPAEGSYADSVNALDKYVISSSLEAAPWGHFEPATVRGDPVALVQELKAQPGGNIWVWGSLSVADALLTAGLVDEVQMRVCPVVLGSGRPFFAGRADLKLLEATGFDHGVVLLRYEVQA